MDEFDPYKELGEAIVDQAVKDYINCFRSNKRLKAKHATITDSIKTYVTPLKRKKVEIENQIAANNNEIDRIEGFISSKWFRGLTDRDAELLLEKIRKEAAEYEC